MTIGKIAKKILKTNYYWEFKEFFDNLPEMLSVPEKFIEKTNDKVMTEKEITDGHEFFSKEEAFGLAAKMVQDEKEGLVWFKDGGELCRVNVWRFADGPNVNVHEFAPESSSGMPATVLSFATNTLIFSVFGHFESETLRSLKKI